MVENLTSEQFRKKIFDYSKEEEWKYLGKKPALIDFYADWCMPCKMLAPIVDELAKEYIGKIEFYKVDTQSEHEIAGSFGIMSIPSLLFIPVKGQPKMLVGMRSKTEFKKLFKDIFSME